MESPASVRSAAGLQYARRSVLLASLIIFVAFLDFFMGLPLVPTYAREIGASGAMIGLIVGAYSVANLVGNVVAGAVLDRFGRRWPILIGLAVTALALVGYAFAWSAGSLLAVRALHGLAAAVLTPGAFSLLGDATRSSERARTMGTSGASIAVAAIVGPLFAGVMKEIVGYETVFVIAAALMAATAVTFLVASRHLAEVGDEPAIDHDGNTTAHNGYRALLRTPGLILASIAALALTVGIGTLSTHLPLNLEALGYAPSRSGAAFTVYAVVALVVMAGPISRIGDRYGHLTFISVGLALVAAGLLLMASGSGLAGTFAGMAVIGLGFGLLFPAAAALVADSGGRAQRGMAFGIFYAAYSLGVVIGAFMSGQLVDVNGAASGLPYGIAGAVVAVSVVIAASAWAKGVGKVPSAPHAA